MSFLQESRKARENQAQEKEKQRQRELQRTRVFAGVHGTVKLWSVATGREVATLKGHSSFVWAVAFAPDGKTLASGSGHETVKLYFAATDAEVERQRSQ